MVNTALTMTLKSSLYPSIVKLCIFTFILPYTIPFPLTKTYYEVSIASLRSKNCIMPSTIQLPFEQAPEPNRKTLDFLSAPLKECQTAEAMNDDEEAHLLCKEIFEVLQNITCANYNTTLPIIKSNRISEDVCEDFKAMKDVLPKQNQHLSVKLTDKLICKLLCGKNFNMLCQTLLWSYDIQEQIENFLRNEPIELKNPNAEEDSEYVATQPEQQPLLDEKTSKNEDQSFDNETDDFKTKDKVSNDLTGKNLNKPSHSKDLLLNSISSANPELTSQISPKNSLITAVSSNTEKTKLATDLNNAKNADLLPPEQNNVPGGKIKLTEADNNENRTPDHEKSPDVSQLKHENSIISKDDSKETSKVLVPESVTASKATVPISETVLEAAKNIAISKVSAKKNETTDVPAPLKPSDEKEINNVGYKEEREPPELQENLPKPEISEKNKISEAPKGDVNKNLDTELTTVQMSPEEEPEDKDEEQFFNNDTENENDFEKSEFEETDDVPKKPTVNKNSKSEGTMQDNSKSDDTILDRNNFGRDQEEVMNVFPEQEDGHFFFYLLSIVLILMAGYLIFHNKQKILALIVEGRHERRRRSHGSGYKKLETK